MIYKLLGIIFVFIAQGGSLCYAFAKGPTAGFKPLCVGDPISVRRDTSLQKQDSFSSPLIHYTEMGEMPWLEVEQIPFGVHF